MARSSSWPRRTNRVRRHSRTNSGRLTRAASVNDAIAGVDPVVFAVWVDTIKVAALLPASAHYMKTFGTLGADALAGSANREPRRAVLFYATEDVAATTTERLIRAAGFDPLKAGGVADLGRIGARRRPRPVRRLNGELLDLDQARRRRGRATRMSATPRPPNRTTRQSHGAVGSALNEPTEPRSSQMERESVMSTTTLEIPGYVAGTYTIDPSPSDVAFTVTRAGWRSQ